MRVNNTIRTGKISFVNDEYTKNIWNNKLCIIIEIILREFCQDTETASYHSGNIYEAKLLLTIK